MQNSLTLPKVTIITVVFNSVHTLEKTIQSIINQTYANKEYIIIDGGSTDGSIDIIRKYEDSIDYWVSETDKGLYYAMNKGLKYATGSWINFMNSGDDFYEDTTIEKIFLKAQTCDILYGNVMFGFDSNNNLLVKPQKLDFFWKGMPFVHQSCFIRTDLMLKHSFDTQYKLVADYDSIYKMYVGGNSFHYLDLTICNFLAGGMSDNNPQSILECQKVIFPLHVGFKVKSYYYFRYLECFIKYNFARIIGQNNYALIRRIKNNSL